MNYGPHGRRGGALIFHRFHCPRVRRCLAGNRCGSAARLRTGWLSFGLLVAAATAQAQALKLTVDSPDPTAGHYQLRWQEEPPPNKAQAVKPDAKPKPAATVRVQELAADGTPPRLIYEGKDRATVLSGMSNGRRTYRVGIVGADGAVTHWSAPLEVSVTHHSISRALTFFAIGAIVFGATLILIIAGARRYR